MAHLLKQNFYNETSKQIEDKLKKYKLKSDLEQNLKLFKDEIFKYDDTVIFREFRDKMKGHKFCLIFVDGMVNNETINENIIKPVIQNKIDDEACDLLEYISNQVVIIDEVEISSDVKNMAESILYGDSVLLTENVDKALILNSKGFTIRSISEPQSETILRGPREGFTESILINLSLVRRKINNPALKFKFRYVGSRTNTKLCIAYVEEIANEEILKELEQRLDKIDIDGVFSSEKLQEFIEDKPRSPYITIGSTERPDVVASKLIQGRIAVFCDGSPVVLTLPFLFIEYFQCNEDYYNYFIFSSVNRLLRITAFILSVSTPAVYVAITTFHQEIIPTKLAMSIYLSREGVPFSTFIESMLMLFVFEIIREAGIRLPKHIGSAVSIVGALVLGQAAVDARFVSAPVIIVTAVTGLSGFIIPQMIGALFLTRIIFLICSAFIGMYGYIFAVIGLIIHLMSKKSFEVPYMSRIINQDLNQMKDTILRMPWQKLKYRTKFIAKDRIRFKKKR